MSSCDLRIELQRPDARFRPGENVEGNVVVRVHEDIQPRRVMLETEWRTHGRGNMDGQVDLQEEIAGASRWRAGEEVRIPFLFRAPEGPPSYRGRPFNLDWYARAVVDLAWAIDPKCETEFLLTEGNPAAASPGAFHQRPGKRQAGVGRSDDSIGCAVGLVLAGMGLPLTYMGAKLVVAGDWESLVQTGIGGVMALAGVALVASSIRARVSQAKLGRPTVTVEPTVLRPGGHVKVRVQLRARASIKINAMKAILQGQEMVVRGSGTNSTTHQHVLRKLERPLEPDGGFAADGGKRMDPGREMFLETSFEIDANSPASFIAPNNRIDWAIGVHIDVEGWPDWEDVYPITVLAPHGS